MSHTVSIQPHRHFPKEAWQDRMPVLCAIFNPLQYDSRYHLYQDFVVHMKRLKVNLFTVEVATGQHSFVVTNPANPRHLQLRSNAILWHKEAALQALLKRVYEVQPDFLAVMFCDADIQFLDPHILDNTLKALQHYAVVQPWIEALDITADHLPYVRHRSFAWSWREGIPLKPEFTPYTVRAKYAFNPYHPGFSHAFRRETLEELSLKPYTDYNILGAGDNILCRSIIGKVSTGINRKVTPGYREKTLAYQTRIEAAVRRSFGFVKGTLISHWGGSKNKRQYWDRWQILVRNAYDPDQDIVRQMTGLYALRENTERQHRLRDDIIAYFQQRDEDNPQTFAGEMNL